MLASHEDEGEDESGEGRETEKRSVVVLNKTKGRISLIKEDMIGHIKWYRVTNGEDLIPLCMFGVINHRNECGERMYGIVLHPKIESLISCSLKMNKGRLNLILSD